jgi:outer membrane usher protein
MPSSLRKTKRQRLLTGVFAPVTLGTVLLSGQALALTAQPGGMTQSQERRVRIERPADQAAMNTSGRALELTIPAKDGANYLGDVIVRVNADDSVDFSAQRLLDLLTNVLEPNTLKALQGSFAGRAALTPADFQASGIGIKYDPQRLELKLDIASERRATRSLLVSPIDREKIGTYAKPAGVSAYVNVRGSWDYIHFGPDEGVGDPVFFLDGATRIGGAVLESEAFWQPGANGRPDFQRQGTRLVIDDLENVMRWTAGDLNTLSRGFQSSPDMSGVSVGRSYSTLQPQQITRPRGDRSFQLDRPSTVEVDVNGQIVRRLQLNPGTYNLRDFPFTQGANDIKLNILDDSGRRELLRFNIFMDQSQLAKGLSEFGAFAGVRAPLGAKGPDYSDDFTFSGFYRRGFSDNFTGGVNFQADKRVKMGGVEGVVASSIGTIALNFSLSDIKGTGTGYASSATFQRLIQRGNGRTDSLNMSFEARSEKFGPVDTLIPSNPFKWEATAGYSHAFDDNTYGGVDLRYSKGRGLQQDVQSYRGTLGYRVSDRVNFTADARYEKQGDNDRVSGLFSLNIRLGRFSSARADYDTRDNRARLSYQLLQGQGIGSYNISADLERSDRGSGASVNANYVANRAELGLSHFGTFTDSFGRRLGQRTAVRAATSLAFADGSFSMGRPIYDSFAIIKGHKSLKNTNIVVDPTPFGYTSNSGSINAATQPNLSSYSERTMTVDAPNAPGGTDLGQGSFRVVPDYRSGYLFIVGSEYSITAMGRMLNEDGEPVTLVTGTATEVAHPDRPGQTVFTNREGRFGISGLAPGKWRIEMLDDPKSKFEIDIPKDAEGAVRLGEITALKGQ